MQILASINVSWGLWGPKKLWARFGSAVLTFIGYKQADKQRLRRNIIWVSPPNTQILDFFYLNFEYY